MFIDELSIPSSTQRHLGSECIVGSCGWDRLQVVWFVFSLSDDIMARFIPKINFIRIVFSSRCTAISTLFSVHPFFLKILPWCAAFILGYNQ